MIRLVPSRRSRLGIAIEPSRVVAIRLDARARKAESEPCSKEADNREAAIDLPVPLEQPSPEALAHLEAAFRTISEVFGIAEGANIHIALLPPLVALRFLQLPPVADEMLCRVLSRDARRYFAPPWDMPAVGVSRLGEARNAPRPVLAAAAHAGLVEALFDAAAALDWRVAAVVPAESAWAQAIESHGREAEPETRGSLGDGGGMAVVLLADRVEILRVSNGRLADVRRLPPAWEAERLAGVVAEFLRGEGPGPELDTTNPNDEAGDPASSQKPSAVVIGPGLARNQVTEALATHGVEIEPSLSGELWSDPLELGAAFAAQVAAPRLVPARVQAALRSRSRRHALALGGTGVLLLFLAALVELWGLDREVDSVAAHRARLAPQVRAALGTGDSLVRDVERLVALAELEGEASRWSLALPEVTENLPQSAYLESFAARADTLLLAGVAERAALVFEGLQESQRIEGVRAEGPIRREETNGVVRESFTLSARIGGGSP